MRIGQMSPSRRWFALGFLLAPLYVLAEVPIGDSVFAPISVELAKDFTIYPLAETGYFDENNRYVVDLLEQDYAYLAVRVETKHGRPVQGAVPQFTIDGESQLLTPTELWPGAATDDFGVIEFAVIGGPMGLDRVSIEFNGASTEVLINVISLRSAGFPSLPTVEGGIPWDQLMQAKVRYSEATLLAEFPDAISERSGQTVKISGFMLPLEPELKQSRFLLTSNPPSCYFHVPGGPAGAVEVFAADGIEASWDPLVLEGTFEPRETSEDGVVYRLRDARLISP